MGRGLLCVCAFVVVVVATAIGVGQATAFVASAASCSGAAGDGPPIIVNGSATAITTSSVVLTGTVDPNGHDTTWHFALGSVMTSSIHTLDGPDGVTAVRSEPLSVAPAFNYGYRLYATNECGSAASDNNEFRSHPLLEVAVSTWSPGTGTIEIAPYGLSCRTVCRYDTYGWERVTVTAVPDPGSWFSSWDDGPCYGTSPVCTAGVGDGVSEIAARFEGPAPQPPPPTPPPPPPAPPPPGHPSPPSPPASGAPPPDCNPAPVRVSLYATVIGAGRIVNDAVHGCVGYDAGSIDCAESADPCWAILLAGMRLTLRALPLEGAAFGWWEGACAAAGSSPVCTLVAGSDDMQTRALFAGPRTCLVPRLRGLTLRAAAAETRRLHCRLGRSLRRYSAAVRAGRVIAPAVESGVDLPRGSRVDVILSRGPRRPR